jgi:hypothetical protein
MINLKEPITIQPPNYKDENNKIVSPNPIELDVLDVIYIDNPTDRQYYIVIKHIPNHTLLFEKEEYDQYPNITKEQAQERFFEITKGDVQHFLQNTFPRTLEDDPYGPGTILASMFSAIGIKSTPTCSCRRHALEMNKNGIEWCENNLDTICGWLKQECEKRKIPYVDTVARMVVNRAINKAKKYKDELQNEEG